MVSMTPEWPDKPEDPDKFDDEGMAYGFSDMPKSMRTAGYGARK